MALRFGVRALGIAHRLTLRAFGLAVRLALRAFRVPHRVTLGALGIALGPHRGTLGFACGLFGFGLRLRGRLLFIACIGDSWTSEQHRGGEDRSDDRRAHDPSAAWIPEREKWWTRKKHAIVVRRERPLRRSVGEIVVAAAVDDTRSQVRRLRGLRGGARHRDAPHHGFIAPTSRA
ncbi:MAG TPA: hypothetical protein VK427_08185 [Kofleriaceae bacterium]|nr:hypothetical protein [Kofleriaceae bacterium]